MEEQTVMKVKHFTMQNVKAVNLFDYEFPISGVTTIGGRNNQGKTSVLNGMQYTIGGESYRPTNYHKDGAADEAMLSMEFTNGIVAQRIGNSADLKVYDPTGKLSRQKLLDQFITKFAIDLPKFLNGTDKERASILLKALHLEDKVEKLDEAIDSEYEERTVIGRIRDQKKKAGMEMPYHTGVPETELSPSDILARMQAVNVRNAKIQAAKEELDKHTLTLASMVEAGEKMAATIAKMDGETEDLCTKVASDCANKIHGIREQIAMLEKSIDEALQFAETHKAQIRKSAEENKAAIEKRKSENDKAIEELAEKITQAEAQDFSLEDTSAFQRELDAVEETNIKVRENIARDKVLKEADEQSRKYDEKTAVIEDLRKQKDALLQGAGLPYPGLSVENKVVTLNGKAWDCMSESMKIRVGCAIVMRINPSCKFMFVDKLEQLDQESMKELDQFAKDHDIQIIGTRVTTNPDDCTLIIKNGYIEGMENHMAEIPKIVRRKGKKASVEADIETEVAEPEDEKNVVVKSAYEGEETDAMKKAKELLARKRQQFLDNQGNLNLEG
jgi:hypothetical protein